MIITETSSWPEIVGPDIQLDCQEMMIYMYLPVKFPEHDGTDWRDLNLPLRLEFLKPLLAQIREEDVKGRYVYLTVKHTYVTPSSMTQRPGWHIDGFGTDDINYIWYSHCPTQFALQFFDLSDDDAQSLIDMNEQVQEKSIHLFPNHSLLRLQAKEVHRTNQDHEYEGMRTFVKVSCSKERYNLDGNSHNYMLNYDWDMANRDDVRNMECNKDFA